MRRLGRAWHVSLAVAVVMAISVSIISMVGAHAGGEDFGLTVEELLNAQSNELFGIEKPLSMPADAGNVVPREDATANERQLLAQGLKAKFIARNVAFLDDMIAFWPDDINYTHLIVCIEQERSGTTPEGNEGLNAAVQRVDVKTGDVETILHGMSRCDGIRTTQWGTVLATEEVEDGRAYEIIDPSTPRVTGLLTVLLGRSVTASTARMKARKWRSGRPCLPSAGRDSPSWIQVWSI